MKRKLILGAAWAASVAGAFAAGVYLTRRCIFDAIDEIYDDYEPVVRDSMDEVMRVRDILDSVISEYGYVTKADLYDILEQKPEPTDYNIGWNRRRLWDSKVVKLKTGQYVLKLPKPLRVCS